MMKNDFIRKSFAKYKFNSVFLRYVIIFFVIISITFSALGAFLITSVTYKKTEDEKKRNAFFKWELENIINSSFMSHNELLNNENLFNILSKHDFNDKDFIKSYDIIRNNFEFYGMQADSLYSIYLYSPANSYVYVMTHSVAASDFTEYFSEMDIFNTYIRKKQSPQFHKVMHDTSYSYVSYVYEIQKCDETLGYFSYNLSLDYLAKKHEFPIALVNAESEKMLYYSNASETPKYRDLEKYLTDDNYCYKLSNSDLYLVFEPQYSLFTTSNIVPMLIILLAAILISAMLSYMFSMMLYHNIEKICDLVSSPFDEESGDDCSKTNEFTYIISQFRKMATQAQSLNVDLTNKTFLLKKAQASALQYQISPHFLLNTLNLINSISISEAKRDTKVTVVVELLSKILYTTLNTNEIICPLSEEIRYTKDYVEIQRMKYYNFDVAWNISEEDTERSIVKFTLQPIIENAIHYGISNADDGFISISAKSENGVFKITVENNGNIITEQKANEVNEKIQSETQPKTSLGLWNTNRRIKLMFGDEYGLFIEARGGRTSVTVTLPDK